jgi:uncharacterized protein
VEPTTLLALGAVGVLSGALNAVAGGGSLLLFPALLAAGLPPLAANVTNTVSIWPGYVGTAVAYRAELRGQLCTVVVLSCTALLGGATGAVLLLTTPESVFDAVVPALVVLASLLLAVQAHAAALVQRLPGSGRGPGSPLLHGALFLAAVYGGYFGGALGVVLLAVLAVFLAVDLQRVNALRGVLSLLVNSVALVAFALFGPVSWAVAAVCAPACLLGGYAGARFARRLPARGLRWTIVAFGLAVGTALFVT